MLFIFSPLLLKVFYVVKFYELKRKFLELFRMAFVDFCN